MGQVSRQESDWKQMIALQVRENGRMLFRLAYNVARDETEAEDACQSALMKACGARHKIRDHSNAGLKRWLVRTVTNEALQILRRRKTEQRVMRDYGRSISPKSQREKLIFRESLGKAMMRLSATTRLVVALRKMHGMSGNDVATTLDCSASEVSRRLHQGMERLREILSDGRVPVKGESRVV